MDKRVLIVENERDQSELLKAVLNKECPGCQVRTVGNGPDALSIARNLKPDVLLVDFDLGIGLDGLSVAKTLKTEIPQLKVIFTTGATLELADLREFKRIGTLLQKPFDIDAVLHHVLGEGDH